MHRFEFLVHRGFFGIFVAILVTGVLFVSGIFEVHAQVSPERRAELEAQLKGIEAEISQQQTILNGQQQQSASLQRDVAILNANIKKAQLTVQATTIQIQNLTQDIGTKQKTINKLDDKLNREKESLAEILRTTNQLDEYSLPEIMLGEKGLSDFFADLDQFQSIKTDLSASFSQITDTKNMTSQAKADLEDRLSREAQFRQEQVLAKQRVEQQQKEKQQVLSVSKGLEANYKKVLASKQAKASQIRAELFALRDSGSIPFGTALQYAMEAKAVTGVDPAFLLAILTQESNLGQNVGSCYLTDFTTGNGVSVSTGAVRSRVMSPTRDVPVFLDIVSGIGGDPKRTRVSCWQPIYNSNGSPLGWGGAMGPAQFIPSTWKIFVSRIARATGSTHPDPWNARDAFFASSIYLGDLGAKTKNYSDEKNAACRYYSGSSCSTSYANTYGTQVMAKAAKIQATMIDPLQNL